MNINKTVKASKKLCEPYCIKDGSKFKMTHTNPGDTGKLESEDKPKAKKMLKRGIEAIAELQEKLYAQDKWSVLLIFQAMDAAGKDSAIKHVMSGINPQGCQVSSFKAPTSVDIDHDYLWRCTKALPERGRIGIFNRSYYEETLVVKVHPEILGAEKLPKKLLDEKIWGNRYDDIRNYEKYLTNNGTVIRKFFLNVSKEEQKKRFLDRLDHPEKNWKFSSSDIKERARWDDYMQTYEDMIQNTASKEAPWYVIPADNKWFTRIIVAAAIIETFDSLDLHYPVVGESKLAELESARKMLLEDK